jgi:two-component system NtrC family sensor kinase
MSPPPPRSRDRAPHSPLHHRWTRPLYRTLRVAVPYCLLGVLGLKVALLPGGVTAVWIPAGVGLAAVLLQGPKIWPAIALGSLSISVIVDLSPMSLLVAAVTAGGNTLAPLVGAWSIQKFARTTYPFNRHGGVLAFVAGGAALSSALSATVGIAALALAQWLPWSIAGTAWLTWWVSNAAGVLIVTPALVALFRHPKPLAPSRLLGTGRSRPGLGKGVEILSWLLAMALVTRYAFWDNYPVAYLTLPLLGWSAFRFSERITTIAIAAMGLAAIAGTVVGRSSLVEADLNQSLVYLESFIAVIAVTTLVLMSMLQERRQAIRALQRAKDELEQRVIERTQALSLANEDLQRKELHLQEKADSLAATLRKLKQTQGQLIQNEKMSSLGQLVAGIAHEINNPISFIYGNLAPARDYGQYFLDLLDLYERKHQEINGSLDPEVHELATAIDFGFIRGDFFKLLDSMEAGTTRIREIVLSLRNFSRLDEAAMKPVDLHEGLESTLLILQRRLAGFRGDEREPSYPPIAVRRIYGNLPPVECFAGEINQVFMNLLSNAIDALQDCRDRADRTIEIRTAVEGDRVCIAIRDNGCGMDGATQAKVFNPFFTTKPVGQGTGLGLYTSYEIIVSKHQGELRCQSVPNGGSTFEIWLPDRPPAAIAPRDAAQENQPETL